MTFESDKRTILSKKDKSVKGSIDSKIQDLCDAINRKNDFYTTSSCAGRIVLIRLPESGRKHESEWLFVSHSITQPEKIKEVLNPVPDGLVWFRYEPFIVHVACRTLNAADSLLRIVRGIGIKISGIISLGSKNIVEIIGTEHIEAIVSKDGRLMVSEEYIAELLDDANKKLRRNWEQIGRIVEQVEKLLPS